ncbi:sensor histidine kinase [Aquibacillus sediminis]|uniref:sensor histidine kinase n=1 Tax=Aquibacillus sediminis TaxID=2574734 RepID=UPI00110820A8|nr:histidine kinase [Aquibacillus sediminis]
MFKSFKKYYKKLPLKRRIVYLFSLATFIPFFCAFILSYNAIYNILENKLEEGARSHLKQTEITLMNTIDNLAQISQQFVYPSNIAMKLNEWRETEDLSVKTSLNEHIQRELDYLSYTNSTSGLTIYMQQDGTYLFRNMPIRDGFSLEKLPVLDEYNKITYYGPHISNNPLNTQYVISIDREVELPNGEPIHLYIEASFTITQSILNANNKANDSFYLILDSDDRISYSELTNKFPVDTNFSTIAGQDMSGKQDGFYWFKTTSNQGWSIVSLIPQKQFNQEKTKWITQMLILAVVFGALTLIIAWLVWKMIYKPIRNFDSEIKAVTDNNFQFQSAATDIPEFDQVLKQLQRMKKQIVELIDEVGEEEKKRADLEIEKLMYQINPHFLMNTLDTVHWLALINKQEDIDQMVSALNKLLYYNLKRSGKMSTIEEELDSLDQYCKLQEFRYQFSYYVNVKVDQDLLKTTVPRFILQPLVENAIYHGLDDDGYIEVVVESSGSSDSIIISIHDNGLGLSEEEIACILNGTNQNQRNGIGIGMNYVKRMLESHYNSRAELDIKSTQGKGTTVIIKLPIEYE